MRDPFIQVPFASGGDTSTIPTNTQPTGSISMQQGWGADYQKEVGVDPGAKSVDRQDMNELFNIATRLLNRWQTETFPEWIDAASNSGSLYPYPLGAVVRYSPDGIAPFVAWMNTTEGNATEPSEANGWILFQSIAGLASDPTETTRGAPLLATQVQAEAGTNNTAMMSALRVLQAIRSATASATELVRGVLRVGTQAEVNAGTLDTVAVTPNKLRTGFSVTLATNGHISLPSWLGGLILQWGSYSAPAGADGGSTTIPLNVNYPNNNFFATSSDGTGGTILGTTSFNQTSVTVVRFGRTSVPIPITIVRWVSIGN